MFSIHTRYGIVLTQEDVKAIIANYNANRDTVIGDYAYNMSGYGNIIRCKVGQESKSWVGTDKRIHGNWRRCAFFF